MQTGRLHEWRTGLWAFALTAILVVGCATGAEPDPVGRPDSPEAGATGQPGGAANGGPQNGGSTAGGTGGSGDPTTGGSPGTGGGGVETGTGGGGGGDACTGGQTLCGTDCVDLQNNSHHCGACDSGCDPGSSCESGSASRAAASAWRR